MTSYPSLVPCQSTCPSQKLRLNVIPFKIPVRMCEPILEICQGPLKGLTMQDIDGNDFFAFLGIPYAMPPIGPLRFKDPQPPPKFCGMFQATKEGSFCVQTHYLTKEITGSEDCLNLNVFTKRLPSPTLKPKPVMVWVHGGAFIHGSNATSLFGPNILMIEDVVVVTINYRLGFLGFMHFEATNLEVPGNAGFKDIVMALRWVKNNISAFNGDPDNVTVFGTNSGGAAAHLLVLSKLAQGLFHKVICQSGSALNGWVYARASGPTELCNQMNIDTSSEKAMYDALMVAPAMDIFVNQTILDAKDLPGSKFRLIGLTIEKPNKRAFISQMPIDIMLSGQYNQVPMMMGYNTLEGITLDSIVPPDQQSVYWTNKEINVPDLLEMEEGSCGARTMANDIVKFYFGEEENVQRETHLMNLYEMITDNVFLRGIYASVRCHSRTNCKPVFFYRMSAETALNFNKMALAPFITGTCHGDEVGYLFSTINVTTQVCIGSAEDLGRRKFVKLWCNFAKQSDPTPEPDEFLNNLKWYAVSKESLNLADLGIELKMACNPEQARMEFWDAVFQLDPATANY